MFLEDKIRIPARAFVSFNGHELSMFMEISGRFRPFFMQAIPFLSLLLSCLGYMSVDNRNFHPKTSPTGEKKD